MTTGAELIHRPNTLAARIGPRVRVFTASLLRRAEAALARVSVHFDDWLRQDLMALDGVRFDMRANGSTEAKVRELSRCARLLRGAGTTFGYPIVSEFAARLCDALGRHKGELSLTVIDAYVDAMKAAVRDNVRETRDGTASAIITALEAQLKSGD